MSAVPTQTCLKCGRVVEVTPDGRGFPPDIAKRKLQRICKANGCPSEPQYRAGFIAGCCPIVGQGVDDA